MTVITEGNLKKVEEKKRARKVFNCKECDCIFAADAGEYTEVEGHDDATHETYKAYYSTCPCCGNEKAWRDEAQERFYMEEEHLV